MIKAFSKQLCAGVFATALVLSAGGAAAQVRSNKVASNTDWHVYEEGKQCWAVSKPKETVNTGSDGQIKSVRRGEILLFVSYAPSEGVKAQVSFQGGYPFATSSDVTMTIGSTKFALFTEDETAWAVSEEDDAKIIAAMKRGATAVLVGRSSRGTTTKDTFSLLGFTASVEDAGKRCGS